MGFDQTMLALGPAGTSMIGERSIEAAARRGLEKQRRRERELKFANEIPDKGGDTMSEMNLTAQNPLQQTDHRPRKRMMHGV